ncbi:MAG: BrnT family toxin [Gammaproteobacteria bacterium]|nr:BrnT family toxin [Gammaproteobacteria bacterium]
MHIEFDSAKDQANIAKHGVSLGEAKSLDRDDALIIEDPRDYGELRYIAYAALHGRLHVTVYTMRGDSTRIISLRKANSREVKYYGSR